MSKFKIGDKVKILDGSKIKNYTGTWTKRMNNYIGEVHTILRRGLADDSYILDVEGDCNECIWDERGLELACKFKIGDKVIGNEKANGYGFTKEGWIGVVTENDPKKCLFGDDIKVKDIDNLCSTHFSVSSECFDLYEDPTRQKIVITTDGKTTTAVLYDGKKRIKDAKATCAPDDTFDFGIGSALAIERLMGNPKATLPDGLDWNKFAHGELKVKVNRDKFNDFMKQCEERNFKWSDGKPATKVNPWKLYDNMPHFLKAIVEITDDVPREYIWINVVDEALKFSAKSNEDADEYEFV